MKQIKVLLGCLVERKYMANQNMSALTIAKQFLFIAEQANRKLTHKKLQKLLYYAQAWSLVFTDTPMYEDTIEAWIHGPVIPKVYHHYKKYGFRFIEEPTNNNLAIPSKYSEIIEEVWKVYGKYDADYLELLTHNEEPWRSVRNAVEDCGSTDQIIPHQSMQSFYTSLHKKVISTTDGL